jgi:ADP-heptose:LPS heptosyltransferase
MKINNIIISRTDSIGDVILTLPLCGIIKKNIPEAKIFFIGRAYTKDIILGCQHVDEFWDRDLLLAQKIDISNSDIDAIVHVFPDKAIGAWAKSQKIKIRIGTSHRLHHWRTCNKLVHFTRIGSPLHEAQLNTKLLAPLGIKNKFTLAELVQYIGYQKKTDKTEKYRIVLHPKSKGSAREWPLIHYFNLAKNLEKQGFEVCITGTREEGEKIKNEMPDFFSASRAKDYTGKFTLAELSDFIGASAAIVACSTGPLHIGAIQGIKAIGIYPPIRPMHPGRWAPLGKEARVFVYKDHCNDCSNGGDCACISSISWNVIYDEIMSLKK